MIRIIIIVILLTGCQKNPYLKRVIEDLESTPTCDSSVVLTTPKDTKETLKVKVILLNYKQNCHADYTTYQKEKLRRYKELY